VVLVYYTAHSLLVALVGGSDKPAAVAAAVAAVAAAVAIDTAVAAAAVAVAAACAVVHCMLMRTQ
jgi:hypothetical protein